MINYDQVFETLILFFKVLSFSLSLVKAVTRRENHASNPRATIFNLNDVSLTSQVLKLSESRFYFQKQVKFSCF